MSAATVECPKCGTNGVPGANYCYQCATPLTIDLGATQVLQGKGPAAAPPDQATIAFDTLAQSRHSARPGPDDQATVAFESTWASPQHHHHHGGEGDQATVAFDSSSWTSPKHTSHKVTVETLGPGSIVGGRYEILRILGEGGMGAVYEARDREVDRIVAFKVIRADLAGNSEILRMFKQELVLARQVTHRNVVRIFDLGMADGLRFITMQFVEGQDLKYLIRRNGKLSPEESAAIMVQVCEGLEAAHNENVIHRDLKPQNIMVDAQGRAYVMDFGLAHSTESGGTEGTLLGTPDYMSPEQAKREDVDARSDLYTCGLILYEMLTGELPFSGKTLRETLDNRVNAKAVPPIEKDPKLPKALSDIVCKLMAPAREERYQKAADVIYDLQVWRGVIVPSNVKLWKRVTYGAAAAVVLTAGVTVFLLSRKPPAAIKPMTTLIADFKNNTGDPIFTGTLEPTMKLALEGASFIQAYDRTRMRDLGVRSAGPLDDAKAQQVANSQGLNVVITGALDKRGSEYRLTVRAIQPITGKLITESNRSAGSKEQVLAAVTRLGTTIRKALGDTSSGSADRLSMETLNSVSIEAVHEYAEGLNALSTGKFEESQQRLQKAITLDPNFGMAYTVMASAARNMGRPQEAEKHIQEALKHIDRMTERERFRTRGFLYYLKGEHQKCVDEYGALLQKYPADTGAYTNIGVCRLRLYDVTRAIEDARKAAAILPKRAIYRANLAMALAYNGDAPGTAKEAEEALKLGYKNAYIHQAYAALLNGQPAEAANAYRKLEEVNASEATTGLADLAIYEGRYADAAAILEKGIAADKNDADATATKLWMLASVQLQRGQKALALATAKKALESNKTIQTRFVAARIAVEAGDALVAWRMASGLGSELQLEAQAYAKIIEGEMALADKDGRRAVKILTEANKILDTWIGRFDLGRAYLEIGAFVEADGEFDRCIKRRGEALAMFLDLPTYGFLPPIYYYQGRAREGMKSGGFADSYRKYLAIRGNSPDDPLVAEVKRRLPKE